MSGPLDSYLGFLPPEHKDALNKEIREKDKSSFGELSMDEPSTFAISVADDWTLVSVWNEQGLYNRVGVNGGNRLVFEVSGAYLLLVDLSLKGPADDYQIAVFRNGSLVHNLHTSGTVNPGAYRDISFSGLVQMYPNDYIELYMKSASATGTITPDHGSMVALGLFQP